MVFWKEKIFLTVRTIFLFNQKMISDMQIIVKDPPTSEPKPSRLTDDETSGTKTERGDFYIRITRIYGSPAARLTQAVSTYGGALHNGPISWKP